MKTQLLMFFTGGFLFINFINRLDNRSDSQNRQINKPFLQSKDTILDYAINNIGLNEYDVVKQKLGIKVIHQIEKSNAENKEVWIQAQVLAKRKHKYFRLVLQEGSTCCQYFEVGYNSSKVPGDKLTSRFRDFITDNGIKLGIDTNELRRKLPSLNFTVKKSIDSVIYSFAIHEFSEGKELERNRYVCEYIFFKNRLIKFGFGNIYTIPRYLTR